MSLATQVPTHLQTQVMLSLLGTKHNVKMKNSLTTQYNEQRTASSMIRHHGHIKYYQLL